MSSTIRPHSLSRRLAHQKGISSIAFPWNRTRLAPPADWQSPEKTIIITGTPRSGSTLLCSLMSQTGQLGVPDEFFKKKPLDAWKIGPGQRDDIELRCRTATAFGTTPNGVCGIKLFAFHLARVQELFSIFEWFPRPSLVHIHRRDLLAQAISFTIAKQTRRFHEYDKDRGIVPEYSARQIYERLEWFTLEEARWREYFARTGLPVHELYYEDLVKDPRQSIRLIAESAGIPVDTDLVDLTRSELIVQRSGINAEWRERFLADCGDCSRVKKKWALADGKIGRKRNFTDRLKKIFHRTP